MKRQPLVLGGVLLVATMAGGQTVADAARAAREKKGESSKATRVITNDDLAAHPELSTASSPECNEGAAAAAMRILIGAESAYAATYKRGFSQGLDQLVAAPGGVPTAERANLIPADLAGSGKAGYRYTYTPGPPDAAGRIAAYAVSARPAQYGVTGKLSFFSDQRGVIHATDQDRAATAGDPPPRIAPCKPNAPQPRAGNAPAAKQPAKQQVAVAPLATLGFAAKNPATDTERQTRINTIQGACIQPADQDIRDNCGAKPQPSCGSLKQTRLECVNEINRLNKLGPLPK